MKRGSAALALGVLFVVAGALHFVYPRAYQSIVPAYLPAHPQLVAVSGACEILGGLGAMLPAARRAAGWGLIALLVAVFPANIEMALHAAGFAHVAPPWVLYARLPLQLVLIWWVYGACISGRARVTIASRPAPRGSVP